MRKMENWNVCIFLGRKKTILKLCVLVEDKRLIEMYQKYEKVKSTVLINPRH